MGACIEELDPYGTGKHTPWGPVGDFIDIRQRIEYMGWLDKNEQQFNDLFDKTRLLFKDRWGVETVLWRRTIAIGMALWKHKKLSEGNCRLIYNSVKEQPQDHRYPDTEEPWPLLRKNVEE